jgi:hypothetical protein
MEMMKEMRRKKEQLEAYHLDLKQWMIDLTKALQVANENTF